MQAIFVCLCVMWVCLQKWTLIWIKFHIEKYLYLQNSRTLCPTRNAIKLHLNIDNMEWHSGQSQYQKLTAIGHEL